MLLETDGLVIREKPVGESDRLVTILTRHDGVVRAFARHAKRFNDKKKPGDRAFVLFPFCDFSRAGE